VRGSTTTAETSTLRPGRLAEVPGERAHPRPPRLSGDPRGTHHGTAATPREARVARVPVALREAARFPVEPDPAGDAATWARVLSVAVKEIATAARGASTWSPAAQSEVLGALDEAVRLAAVAKAPVLAAQEARGAWRQAGVRSFEDFRARETRAGRAAARREVEAARTLRELDGGLDALAAGTLTPVHAERLGSIASKLAEPQKAALLTGPGAEQVKKLAERLDAPRFAARIEDLAASLSPLALEDAHQDARRRRHLELSPTADGMTRISGLLDAVAGHSLRLALDAASPRPAADDERTQGQRQADALQSLAAAMLSEAKGPGSARPHVLVTMSAETFRSAREHLEVASHVRRGEAGLGGRSGASGGGLEADGERTSTDLGPAPAVRCQDGPLLPLSELGRTLCDSQVGRLVVSAESEPLDLGRSQRVFTPAQRRAVVVRDGGCAWEGCSMPSRFCEVHHLDWWDEDHGHTDVGRGVLVCVFHHHELHRRNLDLERTSAPDPPPGEALPGEPGFSGEPALVRPRYRAVPRSLTRERREAARRARLLDGVRADAASRGHARE